MSIIVKNSQLDNDTINAINNIINLEIEANTAFRLSKIIKEISYIVDEKIENEQNLLNKWAIRDDEGKLIYETDENGKVILESILMSDKEIYNKELMEILETQNEIPYDKIKFEDLGMKTAKIKDLIKLDFIFE